MNVLDLFSGIGAYALGVERAGMKVVAFCEIEEYPRMILRKHWPDVPIYEDVLTLTAESLRRDGIAVDVIVGGWPCQDVSVAGTGLGLDGGRSGLWSEVARLAGELRPRFLILENSSNLLGINRGADFGRVLGDLAALGYDAEWHCLPAAAFDAPHIRDRLWIVARRSADAADLDLSGLEGHGGHVSIGREPGRLDARAAGHAAESDLLDVADADGYPSFGAAIARQERHTWDAEPDVVRVVYGAPNRVDRIHGLGNCNPPIVPELIARAIMQK